MLKKTFPILNKKNKTYNSKKKEWGQDNDNILTTFTQPLYVYKQKSQYPFLHLNVFPFRNILQEIY